MALELVGVRVLAPYYGTSIYVWTSIIGLVLGALSLGYFFGGKYADKNPNKNSLVKFFIAASIFIFVCAIFKDVALLILQSFVSDIRLGSFLSTLLLLGPASFLLGSISPYIVRLKLKNVNEGGSVSGRLYAISTTGSILGTFVVGFYLFEFIDHTRILILISILLLICVLILKGRKEISVVAFVLFVLYITVFIFLHSLISNENFIDKDTKYNRVWIYDQLDKKTNREIKVMKFDPYFTQSAMFLESNDLVFEYTKVFSMDEVFHNDIQSGLILGGAAYSYPKEFLNKFPEASLDVVEIDPGLTELAKKHFNLKNNPNLKIYHEDARVFINKNEKKYDVIYIDVYSSAGSIPFHLTTNEFVSKIENSLNEDGIVFINLVSSLEGPSSNFLNSIAKTYQTEFENLYCIPPNKLNPTKVQNIVFVMSNKLQIDEGKIESLGFLDCRSNDGIVFTDNFAPVESLILQVIKNRNM